MAQLTAVIGCILLASGFGRRYGGNKLLAPFLGKPLYRRALELLCPLEGTETVAVTQYPEIEQDALALGVRVVRNPDAAEGIAASLRHGVQALPDAEWYAFFVADQPRLRRKTVQAFLRAATESGKTLAAVTDGVHPGTPTLFHRRWRDDLLALTGDVGGRKLLRAHPEEVFLFPIPAEELEDVDTPLQTEA